MHTRLLIVNATVTCFVVWHVIRARARRRLSSLVTALNLEPTLVTLLHCSAGVHLPSRGHVICFSIGAC